MQLQNSFLHRTIWYFLPIFNGRFLTVSEGNIWLNRVDPSTDSHSEGARQCNLVEVDTEAQ